jgi:hypothetical protein
VVVVVLWVVVVPWSPGVPAPSEPEVVVCCGAPAGWVELLVVLVDPVEPLPVED